ncbi:MAG: flagellar biosynthetic protein FliR [Armatimonadia bacterium]
MEDWAAYLPLWGLVFGRCAGALSLAPPTGARQFPLSLRLGVAAVVALPLGLSLDGGVGLLPVGLYVAALVREVAIGLILGFGLWLIMWGMQAAGHLAEQGLVGDGEEGPVANLMYLLAIVLFVVLNGPHWLIALLRDSYQALPLLGTTPLLAHPLWLYWPARLFAVALAAAAPMVLAVALASLIAASAQRCLVGLQALEVAVGLRYLVTLVTLVVVAPLLGGFMLGQMNETARELARWLAQHG